MYLILVYIDQSGFKLNMPTFPDDRIIYVWIILSLIFGFHFSHWCVIIATISFFNGLQLFALGVGEYIGRIFDEVKQRHRYIIDQQASFDVTTISD